MNCPKCGVDWRVRGCACLFSSAASKLIIARASLARTLTSKPPCRYCGRTSQTASHVNCDGCGAPKDAKGPLPGTFYELPTNMPVFVKSDLVVRAIHG
jgi:hypothetical protein